MRAYFETNFLMGTATGRDSASHRLLGLPPHRVTLCLPEMCIMEALSALEDEQKRRNRFGNEIKLQASEAERNRTSPNAALLLTALLSARLSNQNLLNDIIGQMNQVVAQLLNQRSPLAGAELLSIQPAYLPDAFVQTGLPPEIPNQPTDTLILRIVCADALRFPEEPKAFLSGNTRDFNNDEVRGFLTNCGVRYFSTADAFLGWLDSGVTSAAA